MPFKKMKDALKKLHLAAGHFAFNFETPKRKGFEGNRTSWIMRQEAMWGKSGTVGRWRSRTGSSISFSMAHRIIRNGTSSA